MRNLLQNAKFVTVLVDTTGTALSTDTTSTVIVDTQGYESVCYIARLDNIDVIGGEVGLHLYHGDSSGTFYCVDTDLTPYTTETTTISDGQLIVLDVQKPVKRWHSIYVNRATQASRVDVVAILYNPKNMPVTQSTGQYYVSDAETAVSPTS